MGTTILDDDEELEANFLGFQSILELSLISSSSFSSHSMSNRSPSLAEGSLSKLDIRCADDVGVRRLLLDAVIKVIVLRE